MVDSPHGRIADLDLSTLRHPRWRCLRRWESPARRRRRLEAFAHRNGLEYHPELTAGRISAHIYQSGVKRRHIDLVSAPGLFSAANYEEIYDEGPGETDALRAWYIRFDLRNSYPYAFIATHRSRDLPKRASLIDPVPGPAGRSLWSRKPEYPPLVSLINSGVADRMLALSRAAEIEVIGNELFIIVGAFLRPSSQRLWQRLEDIAATLAPFLTVPQTPPEPTTGRDLIVK